MMEKLSESRINYLLEHLEHHARIPEDLSSRFRFGTLAKEGEASIYFPLSDAELDLSSIIYINDIPVLYPVERGQEAFYTMHGNKLVFHHDLLKSAFHLLSGFEEYISEDADSIGRFPYKGSIQHALGMVRRPLVNYYFDVILQGLEEFCNINKISFQRKAVFDQPVLMLSHDIDSINAYHFFATGFKFKVLLGLAPSHYDLKYKLKSAFTSLFHLLNPFSGNNPFWNFEFLQSTATDRDFRSTFYFLEKDGKYSRYPNSRYHFHQKKIRKIISELNANEFEVGLHGTIQSSFDQHAMNRTLSHLQDVSAEPVVGIRQHYLKYRVPDTTIIQEQAGLKYNATLGFAEHEGFRNSYCWPFKLYDFENEKAAGIWEIPMSAMDTTLFGYRKLSYDQCIESIENMVHEVRKFNGIFSLLWHNSFFDEHDYPGITRFYHQVLDFLRNEGFEGITGRGIMDRISKT